MIKARKKHKIMRLKGIAKYCHLNEPNRRFDPEFGDYSCDLVIPTEQLELLKQSIKPIYDEELAEIEKENAGKKIKQADFPAVEQEDGSHVVKIKLKAGGRTNEGSIYKLNIGLFDSANQPLPKDVKVWGGSEVNVAFRPRFYYVPSIGFGVRFELQAVQVLKLSDGGLSSQAATAFGFTEGEGYVVNGGENLDAAFESAEETTADF